VRLFIGTRKEDFQSKFPYIYTIFWIEALVEEYGTWAPSNSHEIKAFSPYLVLSVHVDLKHFLDQVKSTCAEERNVAESQPMDYQPLNVLSI
jgi:hypothetical protein